MIISAIFTLVIVTILTSCQTIPQCVLTCAGASCQLTPTPDTACLCANANAIVSCAMQQCPAGTVSQAEVAQLQAAYCSKSRYDNVF